MHITRQLIIDIAKQDANHTEVTRNRAPWIEKYWPDTSYPDGHKNREPYCAAACCHWLAEMGRQLAQQGKLKSSTGMTMSQWHNWRCKSARAFDWLTWAQRRDMVLIPENGKTQPGDFMVFDMSHIGIVTRVLSANSVETIEANTGVGGGRDGEGCFIKVRATYLARFFISALPT
jgi:hypothetical protein